MLLISVGRHKSNCYENIVATQNIIMFKHKVVYDGDGDDDDNTFLLLLFRSHHKK